MKFMVWAKDTPPALCYTQHPNTVTLGSAITMQVQNTPHFAAVQTEGALYPLMSHQEHVLQCAMLVGVILGMP
jgi:hypothetical protein